jgi:hypothetical protein
MGRRVLGDGPISRAKLRKCANRSRSVRHQVAEKRPTADRVGFPCHRADTNEKRSSLLRSTRSDYHQPAEPRSVTSCRLASSQRGLPKRLAGKGGGREAVIGAGQGGDYRGPGSGWPLGHYLGF